MMITGRQKGEKQIPVHPGRISLFFLLSMISVKGLSLTLPSVSKPSFQRSDPKSLVWIVLFFLLWAGLSLLSTVCSPEVKKTAFRLALIYSGFNILGYFFRIWGGVDLHWVTRGETINLICCLIGYFSLSYGFLLFLFLLTERISLPITGRVCRKTSRLLLISALILLAAWLPWILHTAPGITSPDSENQIRQVMGDLPISNNHPVFHTLWIKLMFTLGGNPQNGVLLYSLTQILFSALAFSCCVCFIDRTFQRKAVTVTVLLWFAVYPVYPIYGMTVWKDIPFALCLSLITVNLCQILRTDDLQRQKKLLLLNTGLFLLLCFLRHNGILVFIPTAAVLLFQLKQHRKLYLTACLSAMAVYLIFQYAAVPLLDIKAGRGSEGFSIPLQQIARTVTKHPEELDCEQQAVLSRYFRGDLPSLYQATLSDSVKGNFNETLFAEDPKPVLRLWVELGKRHPLDYIESILNNSYGFWYPGEKHTTFFFGMDTPGLYGIHEESVVRLPLMEKIRNYLQNMKYDSVPILSWIFTPAIAAWILLFTRSCRKIRKNRFRIAQIPLLSLWIQMFGSPAYCEYRYVYGLFTCLPVILCCALLSERADTEDEEFRSPRP